MYWQDGSLAVWGRSTPEEEDCAGPKGFLQHHYLTDGASLFVSENNLLFSIFAHLFIIFGGSIRELLQKMRNL